MRYLTVLLLNCLFVETLASQPIVTAQWPRFRGPNGSGVADADKPPVHFGSSTKLLWKCALPPGYSSPIVWKDHIFLTGVENEKLVVIAIRRRNGKIIWKQAVPADTIEKVHAFSSPAASTPVTDGQQVYAYFGSYGLLAYDFGGNETWRKPLSLPPTQYGTATSPIIFDGKVIVQLDGNSTNSELLAVDAKTGAVVWRTARSLLQESWSTPVIWNHNGNNELITVGNGRLVAYSITNGEERWWAGGLTFQPITLAVTGANLLFASTSGAGSPSEPIDIPHWENLVESYDANKDGLLAITEIPSELGIILRKEVPKETPGNYLPMRSVLQMADANEDSVVTKTEWEGMLAFLAANEDIIMAICPGGSGNITNSHVAWKAKRGISEIPSPIFYRGRLYFVRNGGLLTSYAPDTGQIIIDRQRIGALGQYVASPVAADGRIYVASEPGTVVVISAGDKLEVLARNELGESILATPAIADHKLYIRTKAHLWAFGD